MTAFSQRDPRWTRNTLGESALTIGEAGCLITTMASVLVDWNVATDPGRLNRWLRDHGGYQDGNRFRFHSVTGLGADLVELIQCRLKPAPIGTLAGYLRPGYAVLIEVNATPGRPHHPHWLRILHAHDQGFAVMDPWREPGDEADNIPPAYALPGWDAARTITAAACYHHNPARVTSSRSPYGIPFAVTRAGPTQDAPAIHAGQDRAAGCDLNPGADQWGLPLPT